ncbi:MAG: 8-oxoguanine deaminase, partial [Fastidiosipila sp.]|nr:8-oxoguanine deaminase [Fastidiosipila sp.]
FVLDIDQLEFVGATLDPKAMLGTIGYAQPVWMTMINGQVVFKDGELQGIDEVKIRKEAQDYVADVYSDIDTGEE